MAYRYPESDPKWVQATDVEYANLAGSHVNVKSKIGSGYRFMMQPLANHNKWGDMTKADVVVETVEYGWLCIWFHVADIRAFAGGEKP